MKLPEARPVLRCSNCGRDLPTDLYCVCCHIQYCKPREISYTSESDNFSTTGTDIHEDNKL
jgi:hypothetical protein